MSEDKSLKDSDVLASSLTAEADASQPKRGGRNKRQDVVFLLMVVGSLLLLTALMSYSPEQGGWSAVGSDSPQNAAGRVGAYLADFLFHSLGLLAFAFPLLIIARIALLFRSRREPYEPWYIRSLGIILIIMTLSALAEVSIWQTPWLPAGAGGALGKSQIELLLPLFGFIGSVMILTAALALGLVLYLEFSWLAVFEQIGGWLMDMPMRFGQRDHADREAVKVTGPQVTEPQVTDSQVSESQATEAQKPKRGFWSSLKAKRSEARSERNKAVSTVLKDDPVEPLFSDMDELADSDDIPLMTEALVPEASDTEVSDVEVFSPVEQSAPLKTQRKAQNGTAKAVDTSASLAIPNAATTPVSVTTPVASSSDSADKEIPIQPLEKKETGVSERAARELQGSLFKSDQPLPSIALLDPPRTDQGAGFSPERLQDMSQMLVQKLADFGVKVEVTAVAPGPVITRFEIQPAPGVKASKISGLARDLARSMAMVAVRVVEVIPGKSVMGIEVPNENRAMVSISEVLASKEYDKGKSPLTIALGHDIGGNPIVTDLAKAPHMLVAGTTGSGKSVGVNAMLLSLLFKATPEELRLILVDPKMLELSVYEGIPHLLTPVITDMKEAHNGLRWSVEEMERRYQLMAAMGVRNIAGFNKKVKDALDAGQPIVDPTWQIDQSFDTTPPTLEPLPYIVIVIDEFADMMMMVGKKVEELIARVAQKARAAGIHMILATQRPSVDVITGLIKANVPTRIAFQVSSKIDSRTILDQGGAEQLLGHGDMLFMPPGSALPERVHGAFVDDDEVHRLVAEWKQRGEPEYIEEITQGGEGDGVPGMEGGDEKDDLYDQAVAFVTESGKCSISSVQRKLRIGYNRAARLVETMEASGVVSPPAHNGAREVIARAAPQ
ncbi:DNA translocase FtsK [Bacterioplanoides sp. SCSIO 12839]|uniref:DNA translocase FtsK n=1 Tax=Bacterioplanoides sp. SCSIO 12839 TaxID=2829569 RepID=UPI00351CE610